MTGLKELRQRGPSCSIKPEGVWSPNNPKFGVPSQGLGSESFLRNSLPQFEGANSDHHLMRVTVSVHSPELATDRCSTDSLDSPRMVTCHFIWCLGRAKWDGACHAACTESPSYVRQMNDGTLHSWHNPITIGCLEKKEFTSHRWVCRNICVSMGVQCAKPSTRPAARMQQVVEPCGR